MPPTPPSSCPDPLLLARAAAGENLPERETLVNHAAGCAACRQTLGDFAAAPDPLSARAERAALGALPRRSRPWIPLAAAAALLLAAGIPFLRRPSQDPEAGAAPPSPEQASPFSAQEAGDRSLMAGRSGLLTLKAGSRAEMRGLETNLSEGILLLEARGETLRIRASGALLSCSEGKILGEGLPTPGQAGWIRDAWAGEAGGRAIALEGGAELRRPDGGTLLLRTGMEADLVSGPSRPATPPAWRGDGGWEHLTGLPLRLCQETRLLAPKDLAGDFVWEVLCRRLDPSAGAGICFPAEGGGWELPVGSPLAGGMLRIRVESRRGWVRIQAGPHELLKSRGEDLSRRAGAGLNGCGLRAWGGKLEVLESRWKRLP